MKLNFQNRLYGFLKGAVGYGIASAGIGGFPITQITGGIALLVGKAIGKNPVGNFLQRAGDIFLTAPVSGGWLMAEGAGSLITGKNVVMGVTKTNSQGVEKVRGAGYIATDVLPHAITTIGKKLGIIKSKNEPKVDTQSNTEGKQPVQSKAQSLTPDRTPRRFTVIDKSKSR